MTYTIKQNASLHTIASMFDDMGRKDQFSLHGLEAIMNYLEETSEDGMIDLDVIALCCDFTESSVEDVLGNYPNLFEESDFILEDGEDTWFYSKALVEDLNEYTWAVLLDNGNILYINF